MQNLSSINIDDQSKELHESLLKKVSRTFALTIPLLSGELRFVVTHAYLLCRILDTIEDEPGLTLPEKKAFAQEFLQIVEGYGSA